MLNITKLLYPDYLNCYNLFKKNLKDLHYFKSLGWSENQFKSQFSKKINFSLGLYNNKILEAFILGDLISIENIVEYEILLIYVIHDKRRLGYASKLLEKSHSILKEKKLKNISLEVASDNFEAIQLYKKNEYTKIGKRKKYYNFKNKKLDAYFFEKKIDD